MGDGCDQLQADIAAALRTKSTLPPYDEVLRLIDALKGHLAPLVEQAQEHVGGRIDEQRPGDGARRQSIAGAEFQLRAGPGQGWSRPRIACRASPGACCISSGTCTAHRRVAGEGPAPRPGATPRRVVGAAVAAGHHRRTVPAGADRSARRRSCSGRCPPLEA
ncbi:DUF6415 family natural product biosynthesis protein [Streptomyces sp. NPDC048483]|uniref:DUF6415 family natural product biosynthesis protein n=1 Tax=Streptomyces sp. NPDC048483 TaxID=3154927 RepID=UPI0034200842